MYISRYSLSLRSRL